MSGPETDGAERSTVEPPYLLLGEILRPHGIRGELRMRVLTDYPERIPQLEQIYLAEDIHAPAPIAYQLQHMRMHKQYALLKLEGIETRNQAELFRDLKVMVAMQDAVPLEDGEFYLYQLIGVAVQTDTGESLGSIVDVLETGANDVYIIESATYGEILIPVTAQTIITTDIEQGLIVVRLPEGLLPGR